MLRGSSVMSLQSAKVTFADDSIFARVVVWKGRLASREQLLRYNRISNFSSPLAVFSKCNTTREPHSRFFATASDLIGWVPGSFSRSLQPVLALLLLILPPGCNFTSYSLPNGPHSRQVLLGVPLEVRMAWFWWVPDSSAIAALYFDPTIQLPSASQCFSVFQLLRTPVPWIVQYIKLNCCNLLQYKYAFTQLWTYPLLLFSIYDVFHPRILNSLRHLLSQSLAMMELLKETPWYLINDIDVPHLSP